MSANILDGLTPQLNNGTTEDGGVFHKGATTGHYDLVVWDLPDQAALETNQTYHVGLSVRGAATSVDSLWMAVGYKDASGARNWVKAWLPVHTSWGRVEGTIIVPSGMTPFAAYITAFNTCPETWMANPTLSLGSPVPLASSAHTPYATQDHLRSEYATKAALKVTSDAVTAEVEERGRLAGRVGTLESTTGTHTSKLAQLAASITSLVKGESTYTDPDGKSATSGIYSLVTQTRDSVTALFGQYTKTADLASTQAVKDAKKAGTDAQAAASNAQSTADGAVTAADTAQSTADAAKDAIDNLEIGGRNLYIRSTTVPGYLSAGATDNINSPSSVTKERTSDYISIDANSAYVLQSWFDDSDTSQYSWMCLHWYTDNKEPISEAAREHMQGLVYRKRLLTSPANAAYARISARFQEIDEWRQKIKFEKGNKSTDWTPAPEDTDSAVKDAKKAGTDAASAASAAQSTADSLATMIREDATGITVGKSADGQTYSTGRTHMDEDSFDILDKAGTVITQLAGDGASFLSGLVRIVAGKVSLPGADSVDSITIDAGGGVATVSGLISRLSGLYNGISSTVTAGFATYGGNGITATVRDTESDIVANATLGVDKATVGIGGQYVKMKGDAFELSNPEYLLSALMDTRKVPGSLDTCGPGVFSYNGSTANRPTDYGVCLSFVAGSGDWLFQLALPTAGDPLWRRNINGTGWEGWWTITSQ